MSASPFNIHAAYMDQAWRTLKESILLKFDPTDYRRRTGNRFPPSIVPIGTWNGGLGYRVAMVNGIPYYKSSGSSPSGENKDEFKKKGGWYPFMGIEPHFQKHPAAQTPAGQLRRGKTWLMKGNWHDTEGNRFEDILDAKTPAHMTMKGGGRHDWGDTPGMIGDWMETWEKHIPESHWRGHQEMTAQQTNESLAANGWEGQWHRGEYSQPTPEPQPGDIRWQQKYG